MQVKSVPVVSKAGKLLGYVFRQSTSIGASKIAGCACEMSKRFGTWMWVAKE